eukprot:scaffold229288_cov22-Tisochrysis_lutea.AAC.3
MKAKRASPDMCTSLTHGCSSAASLAAVMVVLKSSLSVSGVSPGGRFPTCSLRARRVRAACCWRTAVRSAVCCRAAGGGAPGGA